MDKPDYGKTKTPTMGDRAYAVLYELWKGDRAVAAYPLTAFEAELRQKTAADSEKGKDG